MDFPGVPRCRWPVPVPCRNHTAPTLQKKACFLPTANPATVPDLWDAKPSTKSKYWCWPSSCVQSTWIQRLSLRSRSAEARELGRGYVVLSSNTVNAWTMWSLEVLTAPCCVPTYNFRLTKNLTTNSLLWTGSLTDNKQLTQFFCGLYTVFLQ